MGIDRKETAEPVLPFSMKVQNGFVTVYNGNGELYQQYSIGGLDAGADRLDQVSRDQYAVQWREDILSHPGWRAMCPRELFLRPMR